MPCDGNRLALHGIEQLSKAVLRLYRGYGYHRHVLQVANIAILATFLIAVKTKFNDQYTTIVGSKTAQIVLNHPKATCS